MQSFVRAFQKEQIENIVINQYNDQSQFISDDLSLPKDNLSESCVDHSQTNLNDSFNSDTSNETAAYTYERHDFTQCSGSSKLVTVNIMNDHRLESPSWEIINYETNEQVMGNNAVSNEKVNNQVYSKSECLSQGPYLFVIHSSANDKSKYEVIIEDQRSLVGEDIKRSTTRFFLVKA